MPSPYEADSMTNKERRDYTFARARDAAFDAIHRLWERRRNEGMTQKDIVLAIDRQPAWVSRSLRGPGNWTLRTISDLALALRGEIEIKVHALEDHELPNYHAYAEYGSDDLDYQESSSVEEQIAIEETGPELNRQSIIDDPTLLLDDTSRRQDAVGGEENQVRITVLEPA